MAPDFIFFFNQFIFKPRR